MDTRTVHTPYAINTQFELRDPLEPTNCVLCRGSRHRKVHRESGFDVVRCCDCGMIFVNPLPSVADIGRYYAHYYPSVDQDIVESWTHDVAFAQVAELITARRPEGGNLLDIGCGMGQFLEALARSPGGEHWHSTGVDLDRRAIEKARERSPETRFVEGDFVADHDLVTGPFDVVTLLAILEHVTDPLDLLASVHRLLAPGGIVIVKLPYTLPWLRLKKLLPFLPVEFQAPMHLTDYDPRLIERMFREAGFEQPEVFITEPDRYDSRFVQAGIGLVKIVAKLGYRLVPGYIFSLSGGLLGVAERPARAD